jgi:hypothetical protein
MATAAPEVLPVVLEGTDNTGSAWASFIRNAKSGQSVVDQLKGAMGGLQGGSVSSLGQIGSAARLLANPYVALTAVIAGVGGASIATHLELVKLAKDAEDIGAAAVKVAGLSDALKKVGGDGDEAVSALKTLRSQIDLQTRDGGYLEKLFKLNGSSLTDAQGAAKTIEQIYSELAGFIGNAKNKTEALEIATNAFGATAAPLMQKAIAAGADSLDKVAKTDLDPLIKQSQEVQRIWDTFWRSAPAADGWVSQVKAAFAKIGNNAYLQTLARFGSEEAKAMLAAQNRKDSGLDNRSAGDYEEYQPIGPYTGTSAGPKKTTITPSSRPDAPGTAALEKAEIAVAKHTAQVTAQTQAVDLGSGALARMETEAKLLATATEAGLTPTQAMRDKIHGLAEGAGAAADALARAKVASDIKFDRGAAFLTDDDLRIATALKTIYGTDIPAALQSSEAQAMRTNNALKQISSTGQEVNRGFLIDIKNSLMQGATAWDAFKSAGLNALSKITDKLISMAADNVWKSAFGGSSGFSLLGAFGLGGGSVGGAATSTGAAGVGGIGGLYDLGGYTGPGGKHEAAGTVHKGEVVFSQDDVADKGGVEAVELFRKSRQGYAGGGAVGLPSINDVSRTSPAAPPIIVNDNRVLHVGAGASPQSVADLRAELEADRADRDNHIVMGVLRARQELKL